MSTSTKPNKTVKSNGHAKQTRIFSGLCAHWQGNDCQHGQGRQKLHQCNI